MPAPFMERFAGREGQRVEGQRGDWREWPEDGHEMFRLRGSRSCQPMIDPRIQEGSHFAAPAPELPA